MNYFGVRPDITSVPAFVQQRAKLLPDALEYIFQKYTAGLLNFHGKNSAFIRQEIFARLIMYNFTEYITVRTPIQKDGCKHVYMLNFTAAVRI